MSVDFGMILGAERQIWAGAVGVRGWGEGVSLDVHYICIYAYNISIKYLASI